MSKKNFEIDIVLPHLKISHGDNNNIVKLITNLHDEVLYYQELGCHWNLKKKILHLKNIYL